MDSISKSLVNAKEEFEKLDVTNSRQDLISKVQDICNDLAKESVAKQVLVGGSSGWVVGYLSMKVGKTAATLIGGGLILVQLASYKGYIQIDWRRVNRDLEKNAKKLQKKVEREMTSSKAKSVREFARANAVLATSFLGGLLIGAST